MPCCENSGVFQTHLSLNTANWMEDLKEILSNKTLNNIAIPGSNKSLSYTFAYSNRAAPDLSPRAQMLKSMCLIKPWCRTQSINVKQQLLNGIRYLDLKICTVDGHEDVFRSCFGVLGDDIRPDLRDVRQFIVDHTGEVVIIDFNEFYNVSHWSHSALLKLIESTFEGLLVPPTKSMDDLVLGRLVKNNTRALVIYRYHGPSAMPNLTFDGKLWPISEIDTDKRAFIPALLGAELRKRDPKLGFISTCTFTPKTSFYVLHFWSNIRKASGRGMEIRTANWLASEKVGANGFNIVTFDAIHMNGYRLCEFIVWKNFQQYQNELVAKSGKKTEKSK